MSCPTYFLPDRHKVRRVTDHPGIDRDAYTIWYNLWKGAEYRVRKYDGFERGETTPEETALYLKARHDRITLISVGLNEGYLVPALSMVAIPNNDTTGH